MTRRPVQVVQHFGYFLPLEGPSDEFIFLGRTREFAKQRQASDECTSKHTFDIRFEGQNPKILLCFQLIFMNALTFANSSP